MRIRLATQQSQLPEKIKAGKTQLIVVHFSPDIYRINQVFSPQQNRLEQYKYALKNGDGKVVERQGKEYTERFKRIDLLKVSANQKTILSQKEVEKDTEKDEETLLLLKRKHSLKIRMRIGSDSYKEMNSPIVMMVFGIELLV